MAARALHSRREPCFTTGPPVTDPETAVTVRLLHRRHGWNSAAIWVVLVLSGVLSVVAVISYVVDDALLRRRPNAWRSLPRVASRRLASSRFQPFRATGRPARSPHGR